MPGPRISVVVPFYDNEDLLSDCLQSIAAQSFTDFEVIMVDDGSTDGSAKVAAAQATADPRFRLVQVTNGGPGYARNQGVRRAQGVYLSFVDADDVLPSDSLERMLTTLEQSGSDFVSGGVLRFTAQGLTPSPMHARAVKTRLIGTHISRNESLFFDVSVWNKMFSKAFWDGQGLEFPEGVVWEDLQLMTRAHVLARAVDTIPDTIYHWREREGGRSITQSRAKIQNFRDRITALLAIDAFLREQEPARLVKEHQRKALINDLWLYVPDLSGASAEYLAEFVDLTGKYLSQVDKATVRGLPSTHRLAYHLVARGLAAQLQEYAHYLSRNQLKRVPVVRERGRLRADLPFRKDARLRIPASVYQAGWRELDPMIGVQGIGWESGKLVISGYAYVPSVDVGQRWQTTKIMVLRPLTKGRPPIIVPATSARNLEANADSGQDRFDYQWAGFRCAISPRRFALGGRWLTGDWDAFLLVRGRGTWRAVRMHSPAPSSADNTAGGDGESPLLDNTAPLARQVAPGLRLGARWVGLRLHVRLDRTPAELHGCELAGSDPVVEVDARLPGDEPAADLALSQPTDNAPRLLTTTRTPLPGSGTRLRATVPGELLPADRPSELLVIPADGPALPVAFPVSGSYRLETGPHEVAVQPTRSGSAAIVRRALRPVIADGSWSADGTLTLRGSYSAEPGPPLEAVLSRQDTTDAHVLTVRRDGHRFSFDIDAAAMLTFGTRHPLRDGRWLLGLRPAGEVAPRPAAEAASLVPVCDTAGLAGLAGAKRRFGNKNYLFSAPEHGRPALVVGPALGRAEAGPAQRKLLRDIYYPIQQRRRLHDRVVFVSFQGKQCSDNPLGISDELRRRGDDREHIWVVSDWSVPVPDGAKAVLAHSQDYWDVLARSKYVISNDDMPARFSKRPGQVYVQTWHGTLLKKIGFDVPEPQFASGSRYNEHLAQDAAKWDLLLSPNPFSTPIMRRAFRYDGEICESGYPRNDVLRHPEAGKIAARVREQLGVPPGKRVVLYAPTWRDNQYDASGRYRFDFRLDLASAWRQLGDDYVILVRGHHLMADDMPADVRPGFALNVSGYPDIAELFLASDALITDYSSVMCDFAVTGKTILFYTYDLEDYRDNLRGFNFDFETEVPGPLLASSAEVIAAIGDLDAVAAESRSRYEAFVARFCPLDDGRAGARACDRIFGGPPAGGRAVGGG
jgi:CDP-glycerol glycerophosphotransferase